MARSVCQDVKVLKLAPFGHTGGMAGFWELALELPAWEGWSPGQFVMIRPATWALEPFWARAFSICRVERDSLRIFFQVVGKGTKALTQLEQGDTVTVWGPLGNGFAVEPDRRTLLVAGGVGIAPFVGYILTHPRPESLYLFFGHTRPLASYPYEYLLDTVKAEHIYDQGRPGDLDRVLGRMGELTAEYAKDLVLACGPHPFLKAFQATALALGARAQLSLESRMACGVGACLGCVCRAAEPSGPAGLYLRTCAEGPVFWAGDINLED